MSNERYNQIIDEAYKNYVNNPDYKAECAADLMGSQAGQLVICPIIEEFINKCKTDLEFSEKWGLKIEEQELSLVERREIAKDKLGQMEWADVIKLAHYKETYDKYNIPTKIITLTYNDETIESYE